jgi:hypothetical protein
MGGLVAEDKLTQTLQKKIKEIQQREKVSRTEATKRAVGSDILERDHKDTEKSGDYLPTPKRQVQVKGAKPTELEAMAFTDAARRRIDRGDNIPLPKDLVEKGLKGEAAAKKLRGRK